MSQDKVRFEDQERVDRPDMDALQALVYKYASGMLGGVLGPASGLLTPLSWTKSNDGVDYFLTLDRLVVCHTVQTETRVEDRGAAGAVNVGTAWDSLVHSFAPGDAGHDNHPVKYTDARAAEIIGPGTKPYVWCRPYDSPTDVDTRRIWNVATGAESPLAMATRNRQRLVFEVNAEKPAVGAGADWVAIARVTSWTAGTEINGLTEISAWDDADLNTFLQDPGDFESEAESNGFLHPLRRLVEGTRARNDGTANTWPTGTKRSGGLLYHLAWIRSRLQRMISGGSDDASVPFAGVASWWELPRISLNAAHASLNLLRAADVLIRARLDKAENRHAVLCAGVISFHPALLYAAPHDAAGWFLREGWGIDSLVNLLPGTPEHGVTLRFNDALLVGREDWYVSAVSVSRVYTTGNFGGLELLPRVWSAPQGDPAVWAGSLPLSSYEGAQVGLPAGQFGLQCLTTHTTNVGIGNLNVGQPAPGDITAEMAFSVRVLISKYRADDLGI